MEPWSNNGSTLFRIVLRISALGNVCLLFAPVLKERDSVLLESELWAQCLTVMYSRRAQARQVAYSPEPSGPAQSIAQARGTKDRKITCTIRLVQGLNEQVTNGQNKGWCFISTTDGSAVIINEPLNHTSQPLIYSFVAFYILLFRTCTMICHKHVWKQETYLPKEQTVTEWEQLKRRTGIPCLSLPRCSSLHATALWISSLSGTFQYILYYCSWNSSFNSK